MMNLWHNSLKTHRIATSRVLTAEKHEIDEQCKKLFTLNEEIAGELAAAVKRESELRAENETVIRANDELFSEAQRLSDEEERWEGERDGLRGEIAALKERVEALDGQVGEAAEEGRLRLLDSEREREALEMANRELEGRAERLAEAERSLTSASAESTSAVELINRKCADLEGRLEKLASEKERLESGTQFSA